MLIACVALVLVGCATPLTYEQQRELAKQDDNDTLCLAIIIKPEYKKAVEDELAERKAVCDWQKVQLLMQARQMRAQQALGTLMLLNSLQPKPTYTAPTPIMPNINCWTQYYPWGAQTNCR